MGKPQINSDYVELPGTDIKKQVTPLQQGEVDEKNITWVHLVGAMTALFFMSCPYIGGPVMILMYAQTGLGSHLCSDGEQTCSYQVLMITSFMTIATFAVLLFSLPAGVVFDKIGGRTLSFIGNVLVVGCWTCIPFLIWFTEAGYDSITFPLFGLVMAVSGVAMVLKLTGVMCITYFFHDNSGLVIACLVISSSLEQLQPLAIAFLVNSNIVSFPMVCLVHAAVSAVAAFVMYFCLPSYSQYIMTAEKVTGQKHGAEEGGLLRTLKLGAKLIWANMSEHLFVLTSLVFGISWAGVYSNLSCQYAVYLFGNPDDSGDPLNEQVTAKMGVISVACSVIIAVGVFPFAAYLDEVCHGKWMPLSMTAATGLAAWLIPIPSWFAQIGVGVAGSYASVAISLMVNNRAFAFAPANRVGTIRGLLECGAAFIAMPGALFLQGLMATLPDPVHMYGKVFMLAATAGFGCLAMFAAYFLWFGLPAAPIVLPEDEADLCLCYGCRTIHEVLHVLELDDVNVLRSMWSSSDPEVQMKLVLRMNGDRMSEKMTERSIPELVKCMNSHVAWRRELPAVGSNILDIPLNMSSIGANLSRFIDNAMWGQGQAKTLEQFEKEMAEGRSKFVADEKDPSKMKRLVSLVLLRIFSNENSDRKLLLQMTEQFPDGRSRDKPQLPGTKKGPRDTLQSCVKSILKKYNMAEMKVNILKDRIQVVEEAMESLSYPGVLTVYKKEIVEGYIAEHSDDEVLERIGLPGGGAWSVHNEESKYTYTLEWLTEDEAVERDVIVNPSSSNPKPTKEKVEEPKVKSPEDIMRSLAARDFSKRLVFLLHMDDVDGLEQWLMKETAFNICEAFIDLENWPEASPSDMMKKFSNLLPNERIASLLQKRSELKPLIVYLLKVDLTNFQSKHLNGESDLA